MSYAVELSEHAEADLRGIFEHIAFNLQSVQNASSQLARLEESIYALNEMPERYRRYGTELWFSRGVRIMPVDKFCVFYVPNREQSKVTVIRIMYGGRDIDAELAKYCAE